MRLSSLSLSSLLFSSQSVMSLTATADSATSNDLNPPISGTIYHYNADNYAIFESGNIKSKATVLAIGGLGDSLGQLAYANYLSVALEKAGFSLAQATLTSAGKGWGATTVSQDAEEIAQAIEYLTEKRGKKKVVLLGHSTGTQDAVTLLQLPVAKGLSALKGIVLQAAVSDRDYIEYSVKADDLQKTFSEAEEQISRGEGYLALPSEFVYKTEFNTHVSATRWLSLTRKSNTTGWTADSEDYFSHDLSDDRYKALFGHIKLPILWALGAEDQFYPPNVKPEKLLPRFIAASGNPSKLSTILPGANHTLDALAARRLFSDLVVKFLASL